MQAELADSWDWSGLRIGGEEEVGLGILGALRRWFNLRDPETLDSFHRL